MEKDTAKRVFQLSLELQETLSSLGKELDKIENNNERIEYFRSLREMLGALHTGFLHKLPYEYPELRPLAEKIILGKE